MLPDLIRRPKFIAAVLVPLALIVAWWFAWMAPQSQHLASARTQQSKSQLQLAELNDRLTQLQHDAAQVKAATPFVQRFAAAIPSTPDAPGLVNQVYGLSQRVGVQLKSITDNSVNPGKTYSSIPVSIEATGGRNSIVAFVKGLYQIPRLVTVQSLNLNGTAPLNVSGNGQYQLSISATAYTTAAGKVDEWTKWVTVIGSVARRMSSLRSVANEDSGFGLIESLIALSLLAVVILGTTWALIGTLSAATVAKERDAATGLAQGAITAALAIPFSDLANGLNPSDGLSSDSNIAVGASVSVCGKQTSDTLRSTGAPIFASNTSSSDAPIVPHVEGPTTENGIAYTIATYPTANTTNPSTANCELVELVAVVSWTSAQGSSEQLVDETTVAAP